MPREKKEKQRGGKREGSGRPKGAKNFDISERKIAEQEIKRRVIKNLPKLLNSQFNLAFGRTYLFKVEIEEGKEKKRKHVLVTNTKEIQRVLDETNGEGGVVGEEYYYITTKDPDSRAIDSLIDRTFGKARQNLGLDGGEDGKAIEIKQLENTLRKLANGDIPQDK